MIAKPNEVQRAGARPRRKGVAAVEFAAVLPLLFAILYGLWEIGRVVEVENVMVSAAREGARDASMGQTSLSATATNILLYLQSAEPTAFGSTSDSITWKSPTISLAANTYGYMCWDNTTNRELFTMTFTDVTTSTVADPTLMSQLDHYQIGISAPYSSIGWLSVAQITGITRVYVRVDWACMVDSPFTISPYLQAQ
jgi:Flp pilus assembly protein TadG